MSAVRGDDHADDTAGATKLVSFTTPCSSGGVRVRTSCSTASTCTISTIDGADTGSTASSGDREQSFVGDETVRTGVGSRLFQDDPCSCEEEGYETKTPATVSLILPARFDQKVDLTPYIGTALPATGTGDSLIELSMRGFEPRVYLYGGHDNSKSAINSLIRLVLRSAEEGGISNLSAKHKRVGGKYDYIFFNFVIIQFRKLIKLSISFNFNYLF